MKMIKKKPTLLEEQIKAQTEYVESLSPGSEKHTVAVENLIKLNQAYVEEKAANADVLDKRVSRVIEVGGIVLPLCFYGMWMKRGFEFEKDGVFTSSVFKGLIQKFKPTKR